MMDTQAMMPIIVLKDGEVFNITTDVEYTKGCPTCDFGSTYCLEITFWLKRYIVTVNWKNENLRPSFAHLFKILSKDFSDITETEFTEYLTSKLQDADYFNVQEWKD